MDQPRQHHDTGGAPRSLRREVDTDLHARLDREADALRRILRRGRSMSVDERHAVEAMSAAGDHRRPDERDRIGCIADDFPRSCAVTPPGSAEAPGRANAGLDPAGPARMRDVRSMRSGIVRRRNCRDVVPRRLVLERTTDRRRAGPGAGGDTP